jgi:ABC-2 type transport system permease protein
MYRCWLIDLKNMTHTGFFVLVSVLQPVIFASIAFFLFKSGGNAPTLLYAALGAGLMGIWSSTLFGSGGILQWERYQGTLELLVAAPVRFVWILLSASLATATLGLYSITATLLWGRLFFDIPLKFVHPLWFALAIPITIIGLGLLGLVIASTFILYRNANALSNLLEYPVWLITGLLVPLSFLPGWIRPLGYVLAPTWGVRAIRAAALGGDPVIPILVTAGLGVAYFAIGALTVGYFENAARDRAALTLT